MPNHEESIIELDYLVDKGQALLLDSYLIEDSVAHVVDYGFLERRYMMVSFLVDEDHPEVCLCATDTAGSVAPGFAMLGQSSLEELLEGFNEVTTSAYDDKRYDEWLMFFEPDFLKLLESKCLYVLTMCCLLVLFALPINTPTHHLFDVMSSMLLHKAMGSGSHF